MRNETQQIQNVGFHFVQPNLHGGPNDDQGQKFNSDSQLDASLISAPFGNVFSRFSVFEISIHNDYSGMDSEIVKTFSDTSTKKSIFCSGVLYGNGVHNVIRPSRMAVKGIGVVQRVLIQDWGLTLIL